LSAFLAKLSASLLTEKIFFKNIEKKSKYHQIVIFSFGITGFLKDYIL